MNKSFIEMKITGNSLEVCQLQVKEYLELGFSTNGMIHEDKGLYWTFLIKNNGLFEETEVKEVPLEIV